MKVTFLKHHNGKRKGETHDIADNTASYLLRTNVVEEVKKEKKPKADEPKAEAPKEEMPVAEQPKDMTTGNVTATAKQSKNTKKNNDGKL